MATKESLKERQRQEREKLILLTAEEVMLVKGYHEASMEEIAEKVGIAKGTLYLHFAKKEDLVFAISQPKLLMFLSAVEEAVTYPGTARNKLETLLRKELSGEFFQFILKNSPDLSHVFKSRENQVNETVAGIFEKLTIIFEEGIRDGSLQPDIPVEMMTFTFINLFDPNHLNYMIKVKNMPKDQFCETLIHMYFRGIEKK